MTKQRFLEKISSRKFWALVAGFVGSLLLAFNLGENEIAQITAVITAFGSVAVYTFAEASVDKARANSDIVIIEDPEEE
jgi:drug/metabolite transporter (DMT)-like permease